MIKLFSFIALVSLLLCFNTVSVNGNTDSSSETLLCANVSTTANFQYCRVQTQNSYIQLDLQKLSVIGQVSIEVLDAIQKAPFENDCYQITTNVTFDSFVIESMIALQNYDTEVTKRCAYVIGTYLCSSMFRFNYPNTQPFYNGTCTSLYAIDPKLNEYICPQNMLLKVPIANTEYHPYPATLEECVSSKEVSINGTLFAQGAITLPVKEGTTGEWTWVGPIITVDKYPGGVVKGSILGFGLLLALLLVIASLGFIMKQQQKK